MENTEENCQKLAEAVPKSRWNVKGQLSGFIPGLNTIKSHYEMSEMNQEVYNVLDYLIKNK